MTYEVKNADFTDDETRLGHRLSQLIFDNFERIVEALISTYAATYPESPTNLLDDETIYQWTSSNLTDMAKAFVDVDPGLLNFRNAIGDCVPDPNDIDLTRFASFIACTKLEARVIASLIYQVSIEEGIPASEKSQLLGYLEKITQEIIVYSCTLYAAAVQEKGSLSRSWDLLSSIPADSSKCFISTSFEGDAEEDAEPHAPSGLSSIYDSSLSRRQSQVLDLILQGMNNKEIARRLNITPNTVKNHVARLFDKFNVNSRPELLVKIMKSGQN